MMTNTVKCVLLLTFLLQSVKCAKKAMEGFVVGGEYTNIKEYPHSVFLSSICSTNWTCGAAILNQRILITAAHCIFGCELRRKHHRIEASAGSESLYDVQINRLVKRIVVHQMYIEKFVINDIGLAMLDNSIPLGRNAKRVIIQKQFPRDIYGRVAGWGLINEETAATSMTLKHLTQKLQSKKTCLKVGKLEPGMFCAGSEDFYEDHPAAGDSGGALITRKYIAIGLVSFHIISYPALSVYTNVTYYYEWVTKNARKMYCNTGRLNF